MVNMPTGLPALTHAAESVVMSGATVGAVTIEKQALVEFAQKLDSEQVIGCLRAPVCPLVFEDLEAEVNFLALYHLLDFGSGYDVALLSKMQRDARETTQFGLLSMVLSDKRLDKHFLSDFSAFYVTNYFGLEHMVEEEVAPAVMLCKPGPLTPFANSIKDALVETGRRVGEQGHPTLGALVLGLLDEVASEGQQPVQPSVSQFVQKLADAVPAFSDTHQLNGEELPFNRKAQLLAASLHLRFSEEDARCKFSDFDQLTADSGPTVPAVLRKLGILQYSPELSSMVDAGEEVPQGGSLEVMLRASAVAAVKKICEEARGAVNPVQVSAYLCEMVEPTKQLHGMLTRHRTTGTLAY